MYCYEKLLDNLYQKVIRKTMTIFNVKCRNYIAYLLFLSVDLLLIL